MFVSKVKRIAMTEELTNINPPVSGGGASADLARHVHEYGSAAIEAGELLVSAIKAAQEGGGWTPKATDLLNQGAAKYGERKAIELGELLGLLRPIAGWLTDDQKMGARLLPDEPRLRMGVTSLGRDPLLFMQVGDDTLAEKLGFKHWDRLVKINGTKLSTLSEVYPLLSELAGERVEFELRDCCGFHYFIRQLNPATTACRPRGVGVPSFYSSADRILRWGHVGPAGLPAEIIVQVGGMFSGWGLPRAGSWAVGPYG